MIEPLGLKLRRQRRRLGLTLDELAGRTSISKPYLSLIETGRVPNPPSDEKLRRLEQTLGFNSGELVTEAHLFRTPHDVRAMLQRLMQSAAENAAQKSSQKSSSKSPENVPAKISANVNGSEAAAVPTDLDAAYLSGMLHQWAEKNGGNIETVRSNAVPVINKVSAGYPSDFTDLSYPRGVADQYVGCPDVHDVDAFAARVHGDSMTPKYRPGDIVIFSPAANPKNGDDCFIRFEDGKTTFKRVFFENDESTHPVIRLQPRNEQYRAQIIPAEQITGIYKAMFKYQSVEE